MTTRAADRVDEWVSRPFTDGYEQLRTLADRSFSGAVTAGSATLYMVKGTAVGVLNGTIEDFEDATGTIHEAPTPALPLLAVMQEHSDEVRAKYYSEETPLSEADGKLSAGGFTGYVELSENVLSGDYYLVYQAGKSMNVAFLGESARLVSGDDAFERADEEVGIYEVRPVTIDPIEIPEPEPPTDDVAASEGGDSREQPTDVRSAPDESEHGSPPTGDTEAETAGSDRGNDPESTTRERTRHDDEDQDTRDEDQDTRDDADREAHSDEDRDAGEPETELSSAGARESRASEQAGRDDQRTEQTARDDPRPERPPAQSRDPESREATHESEPERRPSDHDSTVSESVNDTAARPEGASESTSLERRSIPSVDPDRTWTADDDRTEGEPGHERSVETPADRSSRQPTSPRGQADRQESEPEAAKNEIGDLEQRIEELETSRSKLRTERDDLQAQLQQVREERDDLEEEVQRLREEVSDLEDRLEATKESPSTETPMSTTGPSLTPQDAISGTNLFVRYGSKSDATLSAAHDGNVDADAVNANLSLEYHTEFDDSEATIDGESYDSFLRGTIHYRFVEWLVRELLYEIRDTGHQSALGDLYDAIPKIDRVQLDGTVTIGEGDEETPGEESFDVVARDRMGNPMVVTNLDDSRTATTEEMMTGLVTSATRAGEAHGRLAGAFFLTSSFFDPDALETATEATGGGILSRDKRESFVRLSRKDGFHLCLVESRDGDFHFSVPDL